MVSPSGRLHVSSHQQWMRVPIVPHPPQHLMALTHPSTFLTRQLCKGMMFLLCFSNTQDKKGRDIKMEMIVSNITSDQVEWLRWTHLPHWRPVSTQAVPSPLNPQGPSGSLRVSEPFAWNSFLSVGLEPRTQLNSHLLQEAFPNFTPLMTTSTGFVTWPCPVPP